MNFLGFLEIETFVQNNPRAMNAVGSIIQNTGEFILAVGGTTFATSAAIIVASKGDEPSAEEADKSAEKSLRYSGVFSMIGVGAIIIGNMMKTSSGSRSKGLLLDE